MKIKSDKETKQKKTRKMKRIYSIPCTSMTSNINDQCLFKWQTKKSKYLAISTDNIINIYNRHGEHVDQINLFG